MEDNPYDLVIIDRAKCLVFGPPTALYRPFFEL